MSAFDHLLRLICVGLVFLALFGWHAPPLLGDDPAEGEEGAEEGEEEDSDVDPLEEASNEDARKLLAALNKVAKKKNFNEVSPALEAIEDLRHESFEKPLMKLLKHGSSLVAMKAAEMWEWRLRPKIAKKVWKASWGEKKNDKRFKVKGIVLRAFARAGHILDKNQYKAVVKDWRWMLGNPNKKFAEAMIEVCLYFEMTKDKRHCRWMAEQLDDPCVGVNPNDPSTQPQEWQERRWHMWKATKPAAVSALSAITGQEFDKLAEAKAWFKANEKKFGFKW